MKGYVVIDTEAIDPEANSQYIEKVLPVIAAHGGRFLVRTSDADVVQGDYMGIPSVNGALSSGHNAAMEAADLLASRASSRGVKRECIAKTRETISSRCFDEFGWRRRTVEGRIDEAC